MWFLRFDWIDSTILRAIGMSLHSTSSFEILEPLSCLVGLLRLFHVHRGFLGLVLPPPPWGRESIPMYPYYLQSWCFYVGPDPIVLGISMYDCSYHYIILWHVFSIPILYYIETPFCLIHLAPLCHAYHFFIFMRFINEYGYAYLVPIGILYTYHLLTLFFIGGTLWFICRWSSFLGHLSPSLVLSEHCK